MEYIASAFIPAAILLCAAMLTFSKKATFDDFLRGTEDGIKIIFRLLPTLIVLVVSVSMLSASGAIDFLSSMGCSRTEVTGAFRYPEEGKETVSSFSAFKRSLIKETKASDGA